MLARLDAVLRGGVAALWGVGSRGCTPLCSLSLTCIVVRSVTGVTGEKARTEGGVLYEIRLYVYPPPPCGAFH